MIDKHKERSYEYLIDHYNRAGVDGAKKLEERFLFLYDTMSMWIEEKKLVDYVSVNRLTIENILVDYFADITRLKDFHEIELTNDIKVASYLVYWINKRKPLYYKIEPSIEDIEKNYNLKCINESSSS